MLSMKTLSLCAALACLSSASALAQTPPPAAPGHSCIPTGFFPGPATYKSTEVLPDRRVTFRVCAPDAATALVTSSDYAPAIPMGFGGGPPGLAMTKDTSGLWSATTSVPVESRN